MTPDEVRRIYDDPFAEQYEDRFIHHPWSAPGVAFEQELIRAVLATVSRPRWLDLGCGTGYHLSCHPQVDRAGVDLSPAMLARARRANPDARFLAQGDFRDPHPEWYGRWDLLTCTWVAYSYLSTLQELEAWVEHLARWASPRGTCLIPVLDIEDLRGAEVAYREADANFGGPITLPAVLWTWGDDVAGQIHGPLLAPHAEHLRLLLERRFEHVRMLRYPAQPELPRPRKALLATHRRVSADALYAHAEDPGTAQASASDPPPAPPKRTSLLRELLPPLLFRALQGLRR